MATVAELQTELAEVKAAISAVRTRGQDAQVNGRRVTRADYATLKADQRRLELMIARRSGTSGVRQVVPKR